MATIDVWAQGLTERMASQPWLEPLLRWTNRAGELLLPTVETTLPAKDEAGVNDQTRAFLGETARQTSHSDPVLVEPA